VTNIKDNKIIAEQPEKVKGLHIYSYENTRITTVNALDINTGKANTITSGGNMEIGAANTTISGGNINLNGPAAAKASQAEIADKIQQLKLLPNIVTDKDLDWAEKKYIADTELESIMSRIPMHEPWALHENQAPQFLTPKLTDRES